MSKLSAGNLWQRDIYLHEIEKRLKGKKLISFDLYDTILFRTVRSPRDVFIKMEETALVRGFLNADFPKGQFRNIRAAASKEARKTKLENAGHNQVKIHEIYEKIPKDIGKPSWLMSLEIETEKQVCYLNPSIYSLILHLFRQDYDIAIVSDMYLPKNVLTDILENSGFDLAILKDMLVSCEYNASKKDTENNIFPYFLRQYPDLESTQILHIGDHHGGDFEAPGKFGIDAIHYNVIPSGLSYDFGGSKEIAFDRYIPQELLSLVKLAVCLKNPYSDVTGEALFYRYGLSFLGPYLSLTFEKEFIYSGMPELKSIFANMRDGALLKNDRAKTGDLSNSKFVEICREGIRDFFSLYAETNVNAREMFLKDTGSVFMLTSEVFSYLAYFVKSLVSESKNISRNTMTLIDMAVDVASAI